jgi:Family of unknown function (DUF6084)
VPLPQLTFTISAADAVEFAVQPTLVFKLRVETDADVEIRSVSLNTQVRISANQRSYAADEQRRLVDVFGHPQQWSTTLGSLLWTHVTCVVPPFVGSTLVDLAVPCTYDFEVASTKYFHALESGFVPLEFLFSGTVFHAADGGLQVQRIGWDKEARYRLPTSLWRQAVDYVFPNTAWLRVPRAAFTRLADFRARNAFPSWEAALDALLDAQAPVTPIAP